MPVPLTGRPHSILRDFCANLKKEVDQAMTDPWYTLFFTRTLTSSDEQPPHMVTLLHEGEGQRVFQKEELQRQYANVYFVHKAGSPHYTNQAIPNPQLFQGLLSFPENEHMGPSTPSYIPLIGVPPTDFNTPISTNTNTTSL